MRWLWICVMLADAVVSSAGADDHSAATNAQSTPPRGASLVASVLAQSASGSALPGPATEAEGDWPMLGHDAAHSGATTVQLKPPFGANGIGCFRTRGFKAVCSR